MCAKVMEVEHALEDVRDLLSQGKGEGPNGASSDWNTEWIAIVQDVVEKDAGWKWVSHSQFVIDTIMLTHIRSWLTFWKMVRHALRLATGRSCPVNENLWAGTPPELMPSLDFMSTRIRHCYDSFVTRDQREIVHVPGLEDILSDIRGLLDVGYAN